MLPNTDRINASDAIRPGRSRFSCDLCGAIVCIREELLLGSLIGKENVSK